MTIRNWTLDELNAYLKSHGCDLESDEYFDEGRLLYRKGDLIIPVQAHKGRPFFPSHIVRLCTGIGIPVPPEMKRVHDQLQALLDKAGLNKPDKEEE